MLCAVSPCLIFWLQTKHLIRLSHIFPRCHGSQCSRTCGGLLCCGCPSCTATGRLQLPLLLCLPASARLPFEETGSTHLFNLCSTSGSESSCAKAKPVFLRSVLLEVPAPLSRGGSLGARLCTAPSQPAHPAVMQGETGAWGRLLLQPGVDFSFRRRKRGLNCASRVKNGRVVACHLGREI